MEISDGKVIFNDDYEKDSLYITADILFDMEKTVMRYGETVAGFNANQIRQLAEDLNKIANNPVYIKKW